ncbi:thiosulfate ABC transporter substrate-binding protein CysP [Alcanivorax limicola]|uniref:thiosulfate ABC transporter substrate-binding protein CysP n=1 Tax=Alcanivorax limicola TaxID=2874102 RepID=UPI0021D987EF|nr:thiosulfate ABC transporter substrate-binding protein CysP [Alcanivorax limicola]
MTVATAATALSLSGAAQAQQSLLNVSYDIARELFAAINPKFQAHWQEETGEQITINQSHAGTSRQAQAIMQGLRADLVTFNQVTDINALQQRGFVAEDWQARFPNNSSPYYSTTAFLVRKGNPKNITSWDDLVRKDVRIVFPNPKTSGNGRYTYLAAWLFAHQTFDGDEDKVREFVSTFLSNVAVFDTGGRGATVTFAERNIGDVLISFESEVNNIRKEYGDGDYEVVVPPVSIMAEFPVAVVDRVANAQGTATLANAYLDYLYSKPIQTLLAEFNYRVHHEEVVAATADLFPPVDLLRVEDIIGPWDQVQEAHFGRNGILDQLQARGR